ncbi:DUF4383 domain-containing protein [Plantactinospora sp. S1510]|uniref:DUF4383 domain-containing protein n=1 Tax=Plantactinospora alkalitolerans TaxID=2789879 RepID=A0ABS0GT71_9ACTN|nr:DUF4383 domain-containing protein [Plantactinospora alkalitolerans]MBF9129239.1 DUF4383 domain-containing protein [Plantactinospora alkalitolerans]
MSHNPVNHPARPIYRAIGGLTGVYLVLFGVLGIVETSGGEFFAQDDTLVLGQGTNLGNSVLSIVLGLVILAATLIGRNVDVALNKPLGYALMALGAAALAVLRTDANYLNFSVATSIVVMILGLVLLMAGMYGKVGSDDEARAFEHARLFS